MIPCSNPLAQYLPLQAEIDSAIAKVLSSGRYILGEQVRSFEEEFAKYIGVRYGVGVGSGTEALHVALTACGVGSGSEVITVSHSAVATVAAIELTGATPVLVDIEPNHFTLNSERWERAVSPRTKAIVVVHLYGQSAEMSAIVEKAKRHGLHVIEDCAQAHGAQYDDRRVGSIGDIGCFSFYPTKNLGALGDGGMVVTSNQELAERARMLREYGWTDRYTSSIPGWNTRLDELQAAVLRVKLKSLEADNQTREQLARRYDAALNGLPLALPRRRTGASHVFHLYVVRAESRDELHAHLKRKGIGALVHYPVPVHRQPAYVGRLGNVVPLPETERAAAEVLSLPLFPGLNYLDQDKVITSIGEFFERRV